MDFSASTLEQLALLMGIELDDLQWDTEVLLVAGNIKQT
jgi:hypothetical protein